MDSSSKPVGEPALSKFDLSLKKQLEEFTPIYDRLLEQFNQITIKLEAHNSRRTQLYLNMKTFIMDTANQGNDDFTNVQIATMDSLDNERINIRRIDLEIHKELEKLQAAHARATAKLEKINGVKLDKAIS